MTGKPTYATPPTSHTPTICCGGVMQPGASEIDMDDVIASFKTALAHDNSFNLSDSAASSLQLKKFTAQTGSSLYVFQKAAKMNLFDCCVTTKG